MIRGEGYSYAVTIRPDEKIPSQWLGQCDPSEDLLDYPGRAGEQPFFKLREGQLILRRRESWFSTFFDERYKLHGRPSRKLSFNVGSALSAYAKSGDRLCIGSAGTGDRAFTIMRGGRLVMAVGSIADLHLGDNITVQEDPRVKELELYEFAAVMHYPRTHVVWFDARENNLEEFYKKVNAIPRLTNLIVAVSGYNQVPSSTMKSQDGSGRGKPPKVDLGERDKNTTYHTVDERFTDERTWLEYMHQLPRKRPDDLHIAITIDGESVRLCEGEDAEIGSHYVMVQRVRHFFRPGLRSSFLIARMQSGVTKEMLLDSLERINGRPRLMD